MKRWWCDHKCCIKEEMVCNTYTLLLYIVVDRVRGNVFQEWITVYKELPQKQALPVNDYLLAIIITELSISCPLPGGTKRADIQ